MNILKKQLNTSGISIAVLVQDVLLAIVITSANLSLKRLNKHKLVYFCKIELI